MNEVNYIDGLDLGEDTRWWTTKLIKNLTPYIEGFAGKPVNYMEIGVFAGITSQWMLENILTHQDSKLIGIDPLEFSTLGLKTFPDNEIGHKRYNDMINGLENLKTKYSPRVTFIKDKSVSALRKNHFEDNTFDLIYIDGGHLSLDVIMDFSYTWPLLKVGGIMIFDDYKLKVKPSVDFIIACLNQLQRSFNKKCRVVFQENEQCGIRKMRD